MLCRIIWPQHFFLLTILLTCPLFFCWQSNFSLCQKSRFFQTFFQVKRSTGVELTVTQSRILNVQQMFTSVENNSRIWIWPLCPHFLKRILFYFLPLSGVLLMGWLSSSFSGWVGGGGGTEATRGCGATEKFRSRLKSWRANKITSWERLVK